MLSGELVDNEASVWVLKGRCSSVHLDRVGELALVVGVPSVILVVPLDGS